MGTTLKLMIEDREVSIIHIAAVQNAVILMDRAGAAGHERPSDFLLESRHSQYLGKPHSLDNTYGFVVK